MLTDKSLPTLVVLELFLFKAVLPRGFDFVRELELRTSREVLNVVVQVRGRRKCLATNPCLAARQKRTAKHGCR